MHSHDTMQTLAEGIFWFFVLVTFCGAVLAVSARTLISRVAGLALCFTGVAGIYYYLSSPFVAFMQMLVYVGALCVTITFAIMLAETSDANRAPRRNKLSLFLGAAASCAIYEWRPSPCRELEPGSLGCLRARQRHGLAGDRITGGPAGAGRPGESRQIPAGNHAAPDAPPPPA